MPRWTVLVNVKITENEQRLTGQGPATYVVSQTEYTCGGDSPGDTPNVAISEALGKVKHFLQRQSLPEFEQGKDS